MSSADPKPEQAETLRRGFALRIAVALALVLAVAVVALTGPFGPRPVPPSDEVLTARTPESTRASGEVAPSSATGPTQPQAPASAAAEGKTEDVSAPAAASSGADDAQAVAQAAAPPSAAAASSSAASPSERSAQTAEPVTSSEEPAQRARQDSTGGSTGAEQKSQTVKAEQPLEGKPAASPVPLPPGSKPVRGPRLQAGVFLQPANAQTFKANLEAQGFPVYIESRVHIGPFKDRKDAERAREKLKEMGVTTVLVTP